MSLHDNWHVAPIRHKLIVMRVTGGQPARNVWASRLWLVASLLFLLTAWNQPASRAINLSLATVFGVFGVGMSARQP